MVTICVNVKKNTNELLKERVLIATVISEMLVLGQGRKSIVD